MKTVSKKLLSLMLVAILLVSAIPFQAFAEEPVVAPADATVEPVVEPAVATKVAHDENIASHVSGVWTYDSVNHWKLCPNAECEQYGAPIGAAPHSFSNGSCGVCGAACPHSSTTLANVEEATCVKAGFSGDTVCAACGQKIADGQVIPATGSHTFGTDNVCDICGYSEVGAADIMTLDANGGTINGAPSMQVNVNVGNPIGLLPDAYREGYTFAGWYTADGVRVNLGANYDPAYKTLIAKWTERTELLTVRVVKNGDLSTAKTVYAQQVPIGTPLLNYLNNNVASTIQAELALTPGFSWQYNFWKDYSGNQPLTSQADCMNQAQTVYVNFVSNSYTLYFNANGGVVTPTSKTVYFGSKVGTLPTPALSGKVFQGWKDANGVMYTADTLYQVAGNTSLTAVWKDEALVILYVYINGDFSSCNRMIVMDGFVKNNNISRADVVSQIQKYYSPSSGYLNIAGLFDEYSWGSYRANTSKPGVENIQVSAEHAQKIFVMVTNASTGNTVVNGNVNNGNFNNNGTVNNGTANNGATAPQGSYWVSTGNGTGYWVYPSTGNNTIPNNNYTGTNPKTGDTVMIEAAAAIMVLAAAALVTMSALRKRKAN